MNGQKNGQMAGQNEWMDRMDGWTEWMDGQNG